MSPCTVLIAARDLLEPLRDRLEIEGDVLMFADSEPLRALETILDRRPSVVALDPLFASSPRGTAFINRLKADPSLTSTQIVILSQARHPSRTVHNWEAPARPPADRYGTRRVPRTLVRSGIEVMVDGTPATLVDLSILGAQLLSPVALRPNARVRMTFAEEEEDGAVRVSASVVWARFEIPDRVGQPFYRAGVELTDAEAAQFEKLCARWKREEGAL